MGGGGQEIFSRHNEHANRLDCMITTYGDWQEAGLFEVSAQGSIEAPRALIWAVVTDFSRYQAWHPFAAINGVAATDAEIDYTFKDLLAKLKSPWIKMRIATCEQPSFINWRIGVTGLMWFEEWYRLDEQARGTRVEHGMRLSGPLSWPTRRIVTRRALPMLQASIQALGDQLAGAVIGPKIPTAKVPHMHMRSTGRSHRRPRR